MALTSIFGLCFMSVCLIKSTCYSLIYSSLDKREEDRKKSQKNNDKKKTDILKEKKQTEKLGAES